MPYVFVINQIEHCTGWRVCQICYCESLSIFYNNKTKKVRLFLCEIFKIIFYNIYIHFCRLFRVNYKHKFCLFFRSDAEANNLLDLILDTLINIFTFKYSKNGSVKQRNEYPDFSNILLQLKNWKIKVYKFLINEQWGSCHLYTLFFLI